MPSFRARPPARPAPPAEDTPAPRTTTHADLERAVNASSTTRPTDKDLEWTANCENDEELRDVLTNNWASIRSFMKCHKIMDVVNVNVLASYGG